MHGSSAHETLLGEQPKGNVSITVIPPGTRGEEYKIVVRQHNLFYETLRWCGPHDGIFIDGQLIVPSAPNQCDYWQHWSRSYKFQHDNHNFEVERSHFLRKWFVFVDGYLANTTLIKQVHWLRFYMILLSIGLIALLLAAIVSIVMGTTGIYYLAFLYMPLVVGLVYLLGGIYGVTRYGATKFWKKYVSEEDAVIYDLGIH